MIAAGGLAAANLCRYAFDHDALAGIVATIAPTNSVSQHVAIRLGMRPVAGGMKYGLPLWRLVRGDWQSCSARLSAPAVAIEAPQ